MPSAAIPRMEKYARMARMGRTYERGSDCQKLEDFEVELLEEVGSVSYPFKMENKKNA